MSEEKKPSTRIGKSFDFFVGCAQIVSMVTGVIALILGVVGLIWAMKNPNTVVQVFQALSGEATATPLVITLPSNTPLPTYTPQSTYTPFPTLLPTETPIPAPTATLFVPPADGILFQDNFDNGISPEWTIYSGSWLVSNGELTMLGDEGDYYEWIGLNRPEWKNYMLSLKITIPYQYSASQEYPAIAVRNNGAGANYLGVPINSRSKIYWAFIGTDQFDTESIAGENNDYGFESGSIVEIEVRGDNYALRVNGREIQKITIGGYSSGGISLGIMCYDDCPSFDNIKVTYLP